MIKLPSLSCVSHCRSWLFFITDRRLCVCTCVSHSGAPSKLSQHYVVYFLMLLSALLAHVAPPSITQATTTPLYLNVGSPFTLDCVWTGSPSTVQSWYLNRTLLSPSSDPRLQTWPNGSLTVSNPSESYTGIYLCNVSNAFEFVTSQVSVTVGGKCLNTYCVW